MTLAERLAPYTMRNSHGQLQVRYYSPWAEMFWLKFNRPPYKRYPLKRVMP